MATRGACKPNADDGRRRNVSLPSARAMRCALLVTLGAIALAGCVGGVPSAERDAERCRTAGYKAGSERFNACTADLAKERERATRSVLNTIPLRGYGP